MLVTSIQVGVRVRVGIIIRVRIKIIGVRVEIETDKVTPKVSSKIGQRMPIIREVDFFDLTLDKILSKELMNVPLW